MATPNYGITEIDPNHDINDGPVDINTALNEIDDTFAGYSEGPLGSRPTSTGGSPGIAGRIYRATDTGLADGSQDRYFIDHGTGWTELLVARTGVDDVSTAQGTASTTPVNLATVGPDPTVAVPANTPAIEVFASVVMTNAASAVGRVHLFEGSTDLGVIIDAASSPSGAPYATTPHGVGVVFAGGVAYGGWLLRIPSAGIQTYSLRYASPSGATITFSNRRLLVRVVNP